jgi:hypothetical protein
MAQSHLGEQPPVGSRSSEGEKKPEVTAEQITRHIENLRSYLRDWDISPESFLLNEDYFNEGGSRVEHFQKNKLRTAWFNCLSLMHLVLQKTKLDLPELELDLLLREFTRIQGDEEEQALEFVALNKLTMPLDTREAGALFKRIKKEIAPRFLERKVKLIHRVEKSIELLISRLEELLCQKNN